MQLMLILKLLVKLKNNRSSQQINYQSIMRIEPMHKLRANHMDLV